MQISINKNNWSENNIQKVSDVHNDNFNGFSKVLPQIIEAETEAAFDEAPALYDLLPHDKTHYFTYNGSLTTPPCSEVVTWIDFKEHVKLSHDQVILCLYQWIILCYKSQHSFFQFEDFRSLRNEEDHTMSNNFRAVQPLGDRVVLYNVNWYESLFDEQAEQQKLVNDIAQINADIIGL